MEAGAARRPVAGANPAVGGALHSPVGWVAQVVTILLIAWRWGVPCRTTTKAA
jgi:hypothetical protein